MLVMIDNYDSFVYNLAAYFEELNQDIKVIRNDKLTIEELESIENLDGIIISPGPGRPQDGGLSLDIVRHFAGKLPILGVCLGHQIIGHAFGAVVKRGTVPMHGKVTPIHTTQNRMFSNLPETYEVTRYHSLVVDESSLPDELQIDAKTEDGAIMALSHKTYPVYGIQFHPEAVLTKYGHELLNNFITICKKWRTHDWQSDFAN